MEPNQDLFETRQHMKDAAEALDRRMVQYFEENPNGEIFQCRVMLEVRTRKPLVEGTSPDPEGQEQKFGIAVSLLGGHYPAFLKFLGARTEIPSKT